MRSPGRTQGCSFCCGGVLLCFSFGVGGPAARRVWWFSTSRSHRGRHVLRTGCAGRKLRLSPTPSPKAPPPAPLFDAVSCFDFGCYSDAAATALLVRGFTASRRQRRWRTLSATSCEEGKFKQQELEAQSSNSGTCLGSSNEAAFPEALHQSRSACRLGAGWPPS